MTEDRVATGRDLSVIKIMDVLIDERGRVLHKLTHATLDQEPGSSKSRDVWKMLCMVWFKN